MKVTVEIKDREFLQQIFSEFIRFQRIMLDDAADKTKRIWEDDVMGTWDRPYRVYIEKPDLSKRRIFVSNTEITSDSSDDPRRKNRPRKNVPFYLNDGFNPRFAALSGDWTSKTAPGRLKSGGGSGRVLKTGAKAGAQKAVAGRDFEKMVAEEIDSQLEKIANESWPKVWR